MRLLPKSEVVKAKALETQREVEQGKRLATKVDNLRQLQAETEEGFEKYRIETLSAIQVQIDAKQNELVAIETDLARRHEELKSLEPHEKVFEEKIAREGSKLEAENLRLAHWEEELEQYAMSLNERSEEATKREVQLRRFQVSLDQREAEIEKLEKEVQEMMADARNVAQTMRMQADLNKEETMRLRVEAAEKVQALDLKENRLNTREKRLEARETALTIKELELNSPVKKN